MLGMPADEARGPADRGTRRCDVTQTFRIRLTCISFIPRHMKKCCESSLHPTAKYFIGGEWCS